MCKENKGKQGKADNPSDASVTFEGRTVGTVPVLKTSG